MYCPNMKEPEMSRAYLCAIASRILGRRQRMLDADDVVQETYLQLLRKGRLDEPLRYVAQAVRNKAMNAIRYAKVRETVPLGIELNAEERSDPDSGILSPAEEAEFRAALAQIGVCDGSNASRMRAWRRWKKYAENEG